MVMPWEKHSLYMLCTHTCDSLHSSVLKVTSNSLHACTCIIALNTLALSPPALCFFFCHFLYSFCQLSCLYKNCNWSMAGAAIVPSPPPYSLWHGIGKRRHKEAKRWLVGSIDSFSGLQSLRLYIFGK